MLGGAIVHPEAQLSYQVADVMSHDGNFCIKLQGSPLWGHAQLGFECLTCLCCCTSSSLLQGRGKPLETGAVLTRLLSDVRLWYAGLAQQAQSFIMTCVHTRMKAHLRVGGCQAAGRTSTNAWLAKHFVTPQSKHRSTGSRRCTVTVAAALARRQLLGGVGTGLLTLPLQGLIAAEPAHSLELQQLIDGLFPGSPQPVLFPRKALDLRFAVLLMRSGYEAMDDLDFMPTNEFQKLFFKQRQSEQEGYALQYLPLRVKTGDLTDPLYFDYISFSQYMVVGREMPRGRQVFQELCEGCEERIVQTVRRDPALADNSLLPPRFNDLVGQNIYKGLKDGFREEIFGAPQPLPATASYSELLKGVQSILDIMVDRGYAIKSEVTDVVEGPQPSFKIETLGPANLWALHSLAYRRSPVVNTYDALTAAAFLRASGHAPLSTELELTESGTVHTVNMPAFA